MDAKQAGLRRLAPAMAGSDPASVLAWMLSVIPFLVVPPALAILIVLFTNRPDPEQKRWLYTVAAINICLSLYLWSWIGDYFIVMRASIADWLWSIWLPHSNPTGVQA
ncbi:hypothetical protein [Mesorhizobium sp. GbtcB19]|uniref:hypothetical protein n=1 Tax=Mesorhizobium sp. GbtcB19 TaxID=2824764 RepID=UPI0020C6DBAD|nr:hypothetical protein [Mesorhizobium sp. GbtcB19]